MKIKIITTVLVITCLIALVFITTDTKANSGDTYIDDEYVEYCEEIGDRYGICPEFLEAMIEAESSGHANAQNGNCYGLMQINIYYQQERAENLMVDIKSPYGNILTAADYLSELFEKYEDPAVVLAAYNCGEYSDVVDACIENNYQTTYATKILKRSEELERVHGK